VRANFCLECGAGGPLHAHHTNYDDPLAVQFLCPRCHNQLHEFPEFAPLVGVAIDRSDKHGIVLYAIYEADRPVTELMGEYAIEELVALGRATKARFSARA
jgi:hypothetical protein